jgi:hypothetical protein
MQWRLDHTAQPERDAMNSVSRSVLLAALLTATQTCGAEELGRLFFTPAQRAQLDHGKPQGSASGDNRRTLTVNGIVQKHGGRRTVWINGVPQDAGASDDRSPESLPVAVPGQKQPVKVKVGQKVPIAPPAAAGE